MGVAVTVKGGRSPKITLGNHANILLFDFIPPVFLLQTVYTTTNVHTIILEKEH